MQGNPDEPPPAETPASGPAKTGQFQPGNVASLRHGASSARPEAVAALNARVAAIVADLGGPDAVGTLAAGMVERHARLELVDDYLFANVQRLGPLTGKGRTRAALTAWLAVVDRLQKSAMALGLERKAKRVPSLQEVMNDDQ